ncbi:MAG: ATP-dependent Clp protease adaptor ClpS [Bacteroidetes bacterium]|nr:ATP-dependent Clp protease adaptor ClpS [Bacteroidota bacterium]
MHHYDEDIEVLEIEEVDEDIGNGDLHVLIIHNDEVNTFEWVIQCLVEVCKHTEEQAEQCSLIIHFKGKYGVKSGTKSQLQPMKNSLAERGLSVTIEKIED